MMGRKEERREREVMMNISWRPIIHFRFLASNFFNTQAINLLFSVFRAVLQLKILIIVHL